jgi:hypothetical protein
MSGLERLAYWWAHRLHDLRVLACRIFGHVWTEWEQHEDSEGNPWEARWCNRCSDVHERWFA